MDEQTFLQLLRDNPDNDEIRLSYWNWLEEAGDDRSPYVRLMRQRLRLLAELEETDSVLQEYESQINVSWIDVAFPIRVRSPMAGRCYLKPTPGAAQFVQVGMQVKSDTVVCIIEALDLFYEVTSGFDGIVSQVAVANEAAVECNQVLFRLNRPSVDFKWS
jgi:uncharacterized protein (TIGR02996 family)